MSADPQAERLYKMENTFMRASMYAQQPLEELQKLADKVCRRWRVPYIEVVFRPHRSIAGRYIGDEGRIELYAHPDPKKPRDRRNGRNICVLLHELAHHIDDCRGGGELAPAHGPAFAAICMDLYHHYGVLPNDAFKLLAKRFRVQVAKGVAPGPRRERKQK